MAANVIFWMRLEWGSESGGENTNRSPIEINQLFTIPFFNIESYKQTHGKQRWEKPCRYCHKGNNFF